MTTVKSLKPKTSIDDTDNVYYNIKMTNRGIGLFEVANFSVNRTSPIINDPNQYELAVTRFSVPASNIPIMVWGDQPYQPNPNLPNYNPSGKTDKFSISMTFDGYTVTKLLQFIPNTTGNDFYGNTIWNYQEFIDIINVALQECFSNNGGDGVKDVKPLAPPTTAPFMVYNPEDRLCSIYAETAYDTGNPSLFLPPTPPPAPTIQVYFNTALFTYFPSFQSFEQEELEPLAHQILFKNLFTNNTTYLGNPYYIMTQEYSTLALWNDFTTIVFETDSIPVEPEFQPSQNDVTRRIITDFEPFEDINNRETFQYSGSGWKRYYDLKSHYPLSTIDMRAYWEDRDGQLYPIYIGLDEALTMKLLFRKKTSLTLEETFYPDVNDD